MEIAEKLFPSCADGPRRIGTCVFGFSRGPCGVLRRSEPLEGIYGRFPSVDPVAVRTRVPYLGKIYIEKKPLEPKLH